ncbi:MAG: hypothetical protein ACT4OZ_12420 [Gemmatimonadota bacterium]
MDKRRSAALIAIAGSATLLGLHAPTPPGWLRFWITAAIVTQLLPAQEVWVRGDGSNPARRWMAIWSLVYFLSDLIQPFVARVAGSNLVFITVAQPLQDALLLWALSHWQERPTMRLSFRIAIPFHVAATLGLAVVVGEVDSFKTFISTFRSLVILAAAAWTAVSRFAGEKERIWMRDWLWASLGVALYYGVYVVVEPASRALIAAGELEAVMRLFTYKAVFDVLAFLLIWRGMRCPTTPTWSASGLARPSPSL